MASQRYECGPSRDLPRPTARDRSEPPPSVHNFCFCGQRARLRLPVEANVHLPCHRSFGIGIRSTPKRECAGHISESRRHSSVNRPFKGAPDVIAQLHCHDCRRFSLEDLQPNRAWRGTLRTRSLKSSRSERSLSATGLPSKRLDLQNEAAEHYELPIPTDVGHLAWPSRPQSPDPRFGGGR